MNHVTAKFLCVDFQHDFTTEHGAHFQPRPCVHFINHELVPFFRTHQLLMAEIISDYRQPRPGHRGHFCQPGTEGYQSNLPADVKEAPVWIKAANSPLWTRENIGQATRPPGIPYQDPALFGQWIEDVVGRPGNVDVILGGLTIDRCVLATAQELDWRGYRVFVLEEAVDPYSGNQDEKRHILHGSILNNWATPIRWEDCRKRLWPQTL
jgi:nicotinamidase-related amidase